MTIVISVVDRQIQTLQGREICEKSLKWLDLTRGRVEGRRLTGKAQMLRRQVDFVRCGVLQDLAGPFKVYIRQLGRLCQGPVELVAKSWRHHEMHSACIKPTKEASQCALDKRCFRHEVFHNFVGEAVWTIVRLAMN